MKSSSLSLKIPPQLARRLKRLSVITERSKNHLATEALEEYILTQEWQVKAIQEGMKQIEKGDVIPFEEAKASWEKILED